MGNLIIWLLFHAQVPTLEFLTKIACLALFWTYLQVKKNNA